MKNKILLLFVTIISSKAFAQVDLNNTGIFYLSNSTDIVYVNGSFSNASTSRFTNKGQFYLKQNLVNNESSMAAGSGTLYLNGTALQTVSGSQTFKTFNLETNNAAGFQLNNNLSVTGSHVFTSGMITGSLTPNYMI